MVGPLLPSVGGVTEFVAEDCILDGDGGPIPSAFSVLFLMCTR